MFLQWQSEVIKLTILNLWINSQTYSVDEEEKIINSNGCLVKSLPNNILFNCNDNSSFFFLFLENYHAQWIINPNRSPWIFEKLAFQIRHVKYNSVFFGKNIQFNTMFYNKAYVNEWIIIYGWQRELLNKNQLISCRRKKRLKENFCFISHFFLCKR